MNINEASNSKTFIGTSKEKFFYHNTLLCLVKSLQGQNITVDLRNDSYVCGMAILVDGYMNISFSNAVYCDPQGNEFSFEQLFVQSRNIRYVHIPENSCTTQMMELKNSFHFDGNKKQKIPNILGLSQFWVATETYKTRKCNALSLSAQCPLDLRSVKYYPIWENFFQFIIHIKTPFILQISILNNIKKEVYKDVKKEKKPTEKSRKAKKALQRHMQVVASLKYSES